MKDLLRAEFGLQAEILEPLSGGRVNRLWKCGDWAVKVYDHRLVPAERAERAIHLQAKAAALGFPVPDPRKTRSNSLWAESKDGMVVVMPFVRGHRRERGSLNLTEAASLGSMLGSLHQMLSSLSFEQGAPPRPPLPDTAIGRWAHVRDQALSIEPRTAFDDLLAEVADYCCETLTRTPQGNWEARPWQFCHGDLHLDNVLFDEAGRVVGLLDFDNAAPSWAGVELMMAWNLGFCPDPGEPRLTPEAARFFREYKRANRLACDLVPALRAYWYTLMTNTWPATLRYREGTVKTEWLEVISMRYRAARWLEANLVARKVGFAVS